MVAIPSRFSGVDISRALLGPAHVANGLDVQCVHHEDAKFLFRRVGKTTVHSVPEIVMNTVRKRFSVSWRASCAQVQTGIKMPLFCSFGTDCGHVESISARLISDHFVISFHRSRVRGGEQRRGT